VTINRERKTVTTVVGDLPISPLMDPSFHQARGRFTKPKAPPSQYKPTKWQRHLARNPYGNLFGMSLQRELFSNYLPAKALATPVRRCTISGVDLPSFFLQRFALVSHPETGKPWFVPCDLETKVPTTSAVTGEKISEEAETELDPAEDQPLETAEELSPNDTQDTASPENPPQQLQVAPAPRPALRQPGTPTRKGPSAYVLSRQRLLRELQLPNSLYFGQHRRLLRQSDRGQGVLTAVLNSATWTADMDAVLLELMRRRALEGLLHVARLVRDQGRAYLAPCARWDDAKELSYRGCLLFLGTPSAAGVGGSGESEYVPPKLSTMDVGPVKFGRMLAVHNLPVLLGEEHVARLRRESELLGNGSLFMLAGLATVKLQMLLWKLQGYVPWEELPEIPSSEEEVPKSR
jgi:hypothetical protein